MSVRRPVLCPVAHSWSPSEAQGPGPAEPHWRMYAASGTFRAFGGAAANASSLKKQAAREKPPNSFATTSPATDRALPPRNARRGQVFAS